MKMYILLGNKSVGWTEYYFNSQGVLAGYKVVSDMTPEQLLKVAELLPVNLVGLQRLADGTGSQLKEVKIDWSFDRWWELFNYPRNKKRAEMVWKRLKEVERQKCFTALEAYNRYCSRNRWYNKQYPDTWLHNGGYNEPWDKI